MHFTTLFSHHGSVWYILYFLGNSRVRMVLRCQYVHRTQKSPDLELKNKVLQRTQKKAVPRSQADIRSQQLCVCFFFPFFLDVKFVVSSSRGHTGFLIHLRSAVRAFVFLARRIQLFLSLVDREVELRKNPSYRDSNSRPNVSESYEVTN